MPHDVKGQPLKAGDSVLIRATVKTVYEGEEACNADFVVDQSPVAPEEYRPQITCNTRLVEKVEAP